MKLLQYERITLSNFHLNMQFIWTCSGWGLFMPEIVPLVSKHFIETIEQNALREIAFEILRPYISMPDVGSLENTF